MLSDHTSNAMLLPLWSRRQFVSMVALLGSSAVGAAYGPGRAAAALQDEDEGIVDPVAVAMSSIPHMAALGARPNGGINLIFDRNVLLERQLVSPEAFTFLPLSLQAVVTEQAFATLPEDPNIYTANMVTKLFVFGDVEDAKDWLKTINEPWLTGSANVYGEEEAGVQGHALVSYEVPDRYQPSLTNTAWHGAFRHGSYVWEQIHASVLPELATGAGLNLVVEIAAEAKRSMRDLVPSPLTSGLIIPADATDVLLVPTMVDGEVVSLHGESDDALDRRVTFNLGAERAATTQFNTISGSGRRFFFNQNVLEFRDFESARDALGSLPDRYETLDGSSGTNRLFFDDPSAGDVLTFADVAIANAFVLDANGTYFAGTEMIWVEGNRLQTHAVVSLEPAAERDAASVYDSDEFRRQMQIHAEIEDAYRRQREDEEAAEKFLWIAALSGFSVGN